MEYINKLSEHNVFVQIGTNDGNDVFRELVYNFKPHTIVLVEPNSSLYPSIIQNYQEISQFSRIILVDKCIYDKNDEEVSLYIPAKDGIYGNPGEQPERPQGNHIYTHVNFSLLPLNEWGEKKDMVEIKAKTITFNTLCEQYGISHINYLQIDTEGYDSQIISSIDFNKINVDIIRYEKWPFDENNFTKYHNENKHLYGINGMKNVENILTKLNYTLHDIKDWDGDDIIAVKQAI
jgi:FkbM family methyltransferase